MSRSPTKLWATGPSSKLAQNKLRHLKCIFAFLHNLSSLVWTLQIFALQLCGLGVWRLSHAISRWIKDAIILDTGQHSSSAQVQISAEFTWEYRHQWAAVGQNWSTDIFNGNKKLAAMCHGRFCFQAPLIAQGRKNGQKWRKQTNGKIFNELQGNRIAAVVTVGW